jgi:competence protein ComEA
MSQSSIPPPTPREALIARGEQLAIALLALALVAGVAYRALSYWRAGAEPIEVLPPAGGPTYRVDVNSADWVTLSMVPGLGEALSKRIVEVRDARPGKRFTSLDEIKEVRGIGDKVLAKLRPYLCLGEPGASDEPVRMLGGESAAGVVGQRSCGEPRP